MERNKEERGTTRRKLAKILSNFVKNSMLCHS